MNKKLKIVIIAGCIIWAVVSVYWFLYFFYYPHKVNDLYNELMAIDNEKHRIIFLLADTTEYSKEYDRIKYGSVLFLDTSLIKKTGNISYVKELELLDNKIDSKSYEYVNTFKHIKNKEDFPEQNALYNSIRLFN